ncbi:hypothetical protein GCM10011343_26490 [Flavobacterium orientale]|uniref:Uncharacterized protein n=2 Tax=Flavobacterium orientale TaxID=1756020 RepID=A0A916Y9V8_9FLAO|nr:hypothetical protein GCM10011343_26490 [Flavobacterium orientale]
MVVAITSAFAFQNDGKAETISVIGWIDHPSPCTIQFSCDNTGTDVCTAMYLGVEYEVKGKVTPSSNTCTRVLTRAN